MWWQFYANLWQFDKFVAFCNMKDTAPPRLGLELYISSLQLNGSNIRVLKSWRTYLQLARFFGGRSIFIIYFKCIYPDNYGKFMKSVLLNTFITTISVYSFYPFYYAYSFLSVNCILGNGDSVCLSPGSDTFQRKSYVWIKILAQS